MPKLARQPWMKTRAAERAMTALGARGKPARYVGGCVRDAILKRPVKDIDVATPEPPETVMELLRAAGIRAIPTGIEHGTVTALDGEERFEVTTLRHDVETFGRHARVAFTDDWKGDAHRRDFTINALYLDPDGTLHDPVKGLVDLKAGRVRFVGDPETRIREDVLRLLRFFRFQAYYGKQKPDKKALAACAALAPEVANLAAERVWHELSRILIAPNAADILELMAKHGVLRHVLPEARLIGRLRALAKIEKTQKLAPDPVRSLAAASALKPEQAGALARRLRFSRADERELAQLVAHGTRLSPQFDEVARKNALYRYGADDYRGAVLLAWATVAAAKKMTARDTAAWKKLLDLPKRWPVPAFPLGGMDALATGTQRGPEIGRLLHAVEDWWIAGGFRADRMACVRRLQELVNRGTRHAKA